MFIFLQILINQLKLQINKTRQKMGGSPSKQQPKTENITINHPKFKQIKLLKQQGVIRSNITIQHESDYEEWEQKLNKIASLDDQVILLPKAYQYTRKAICGSSGSIKIDYDNYPYLLADELKNRQKVRRYFQQPQIWYLLYSLVTAAHDFQKINSKVGDIRPENIFINEEGHLKVSNLYSWPAQVSNYVKCVYDHQKTYLAPQQAQAAKQGQSQTFIDKFKAQSFSIGLTCLQAGLIRSHLDDLYYSNKSFNSDRFSMAMNQWWSLIFKSFNQQTQILQQKQYSDILKLTITGLCELQHNQRLLAEQVYHWLKSFHKQINELLPFQPGFPPLKNLNKYSNMLNNSKLNYQQGKVSGKVQGPTGFNAGIPQNPNINIDINKNTGLYNQRPNSGAHFQMFKNYSDPNSKSFMPNIPNKVDLNKNQLKQFYNNYSNPSNNYNVSLNTPTFAAQQPNHPQTQIGSNHSFNNQNAYNSISSNYSSLQNNIVVSSQNVKQPTSQYQGPPQYQASTQYQPQSQYQQPKAPFNPSSVSSNVVNSLSLNNYFGKAGGPLHSQITSKNNNISLNTGSNDFLKQIDQQILKSKQGFK